MTTVKKGCRQRVLWCLQSQVGYLIPSDKTPLMLTLRMLGNFSCFCCRLLTFLKFTFSKKIRVSITVWRSKPLETLNGFLSGRTERWSWSNSKLFAKIISRWRKSPLACKAFKHVLWWFQWVQVCLFFVFSVKNFSNGVGTKGSITSGSALFEK